MLTVSQLSGQTLRGWLNRLTPGRVACLAAGVVILTGGVSLANLQQIGQTVTLPLLSLMGLSIIALAVHEVGVFAWAAHYVARISGGDGRRLFTNLYILSAVVTVLFPNDATILLFTPLVWGILVSIRDRSWDSLSYVPFLFTIVFGANAASIALVTSNPINMIYATHFDLAYLTYAQWMLLPGLASTIVCYVLLRWLNRNYLPHSYRLSATSIPKPKQIAPFVVAVVVVLGMFVSYFVLSALGLAYHYAILVGSIAIVWAVVQAEQASLSRVVQGLPWDEILFVGGMFVVAFGLTNSGLVDLLHTALTYLTQQSLLVIAIGNSLLVTLGANLINDWPMSLFSSLAIDELTGVSDSAREMVIYTSIISANLGNKILPAGSLATLIWMGVIRRISGIHISWGQFIKIGLIVTPPTLLAASLTLWLEFMLWG